MKTLVKILLGAVGAVVLVLILAAVILPLVYDKEDLKSAIAIQVQKQTGRDLLIGGDLDFSVFPWLAVEVGQLSLSNAKGFGDQPMARINKARVGVALMPLFKKQLVADEITLDGLQLSLVVNAKGKSNWEDLAANSETATTPATDSSDSGPGLFSTGRIAGLNIRDSQIEYQDQQAGTHYRMERFSLSTGALGEGKPVAMQLTMGLEDVTAGTRMDVDLAATAALDFDARRYLIDDLKADINTMTAEHGTGETISIRAPKLQIDLSAQTLNLDSFTVVLAGLEGSGKLSASSVMDEPSFTGTFKVAEFSPARLMKDLNMDAPATTDPNALQRARFNTSFSGNSNALKLADFNLELDQSNFTGELSVKNFDRPAIRFDFKVDALNIDRYLAPATDTTAPAEDVAIPQEELRDQDLQGTLQVAALHLAGLDFTDAVVGLNLSQGKLRINPLTAGFYDGRYSGNITLDSSGATPVLSLDEKLDSVTLQRLLGAVSKSESLSGMAVGHVRLTGRGASSSAMLSSLNGELGMNLSEGALEGINIWYEIRRGYALFKGLPPPPPEPKRTVFSRMQMDAKVADGVITTRDLVGELPFLTLRGDGAVNLGDSAVDMHLVAAVRNLPELSQDPLSAELKGKQLPFRISGSVDDPKLTVDWAALLKGEATNLLLDKLGLKSSPTEITPAADGAATDSSAPGSDAQEPTTKPKPKEMAKGLLRDLLGPKKKDQEKKDQQKSEETDSDE